jgi:hypothetical protein
MNAWGIMGRESSQLRVGGTGYGLADRDMRGGLLTMTEWNGCCKDGRFAIAECA